MSWIVNFHFDVYGGFASEDLLPDAPTTWPLTKIPHLIRNDDLPIGDFAYSFWGQGVWLVSDRALPLLDQPGILRLGDVYGMHVIQVLLQIDLLDRTRSEISDYGHDWYEAIELLELADDVVGRAVFRLPEPNSSYLLCGTEWKNAYERAGLTGLRFEPAKIG
jgi:hypothetical protein